MSQPSVEEYFRLRKRPANDDLHGKTKLSRLEPGQGGGKARDVQHRKRPESPASVLFEKLGSLSPKKHTASIPEAKTPQKKQEKEEQQMDSGSVTPKKIKSASSASKTLGNSGPLQRTRRLAEIKASIDKLSNSKEKLEKLKSGETKPLIAVEKSKDVEFEIPVSPQKYCRSPSKLLMSPRKNVQLPSSASPQRRILETPKEQVSVPLRSSPVKVPAYKAYCGLAEKESFPLPYGYKHLAEIFRCIDTVVAMLYNRKETITFAKLKPAVQEMLRRDLTLDHLAQIKQVYPDAYEFRQEKLRDFGQPSAKLKYELVIVPIVENTNGRNTPDPDNILKSATATSMNPSIILERRRKFYHILTERVKDEHEKFLTTLSSPVKAPRDQLKRYHPAFDVDSCKSIDKAELPQTPELETMSAMNTLDKARKLFDCGTRMDKALKLLEAAQMTSKSSQANEAGTFREDDATKMNSSVIDTPPDTPTSQMKHSSRLFKGIPKNLLEKVRQKQAAKDLEAMTRPASANKVAAKYARLPEMAKILYNIFVVEKKNVLSLEFVLQKLDNSYRTKLTMSELEEHVRLICNILPNWATIHFCRQINYLKIAKNVELAKAVERLEVEANAKASRL